MGRRLAGEILAGADLVQLFVTNENQLRFLSIRICTYQRRNAGSLLLTLQRRLPQPLGAGAPASRFGKIVNAGRVRLGLAPPPLPDWEELARLTVPCDELVDNETIEFPVGSVNTSHGDLLAFKIMASGTRPGAAPSVILSDQDGERIEGHASCYVAGKGQSLFGLLAVAVYGPLMASTPIPQSILYSPVTQCNLNCIHCISADTRKSLNRLPDSIKAQMQGWAEAGHIECLASDYSGDILWADHRFGGELDFLFGLGVRFHIDTNGTHLTPEVSDRLCASKMDTINISLDAATDETFRRIRKGAKSLRAVIDNIDALVRARAAAGAKFKISLSMTLMRSNLAEWPEFLRMAKRLGVDHVYARHLEAYTAEMEEESLWHDQAAFNAARLGALALADELGVGLSVPLPFSFTPRKGRMACSVPWKFAMILGNGDVAACCIPGLVMGNLHENTMEEIWNGPNYQELRATVNSDKPKPTCAACPMQRRTDDADSYLIYSALKRMQQRNSDAAADSLDGGRGDLVEDGVAFLSRGAV